MQQLRIFLDIQELWRLIDPDSPAARRPEMGVVQSDGADKVCQGFS